MKSFLISSQKACNFNWLQWALNTGFLWLEKLIGHGYISMAGSGEDGTECVSPEPEVHWWDCFWLVWACQAYQRIKTQTTNEYLALECPSGVVRRGHAQYYTIWDQPPVEDRWILCQIVLGGTAMATCPIHLLPLQRCYAKSYNVAVF